MPLREIVVGLADTNWIEPTSDAATVMVADELIVPVDAVTKSVPAQLISR